jgi:Nucleoside recognition.
MIEKISPYMSVVGLPGDAAIPLVMGNAINLYAGIGAILPLELTVKEVFILAMMLSFSHNLFVEISVAAKAGVRFITVLAFRLGLAISSAFLIDRLWNGGNRRAVYGLIPPVSHGPEGGMEIFAEGLRTAFFGVLQLAIFVIPLMAIIQLLKDYRWLEKFSFWLSPLTRFLGMSANTSLVLATGLLFGLAYGAGVLIRSVKEDGVSRRDATLAFLFLVACHAVVEDTLIFVPLGIPVFYLLLIRMLTALLLTASIGYFWKKPLVESRELTYGK